MTVIGLTGNIASGKTLVSKTLKELGAQVIDADAVARRIVEPGTLGWSKIKNEFGAKVIGTDGTIDRKALGSIVFADHQRLAELNSITHPIIIKTIQEEIGKFRSQAAASGDVLVVDAALLIETGLHNDVDVVWLVDVPPEIQLQRLAERDHLSREQAMERISSQLSGAEKKKFAKVIIDNSGKVSSTIEAVRNLWKGLGTGARVEIIETEQK